jgi:ESCRT-II complex subunit VPS22
MRRGVGIKGHKQAKAKQEQAKKVGNEMQAQLLTEMQGQLEEFRKHLEEFAVKHKKEINDNPVFRKEFLKMCKEIGVDPLSCKFRFIFIQNSFFFQFYSHLENWIYEQTVRQIYQ